MNELAARHCQPQKGQAAMTSAEVSAHLSQAAGWALVNGAIEKAYRFTDYHRTIAFVNALAWIANAEDHHPDLLVSYSRCVVRFNTHSVQGISVNDFICAAKLDALVS